MMFNTARKNPRITLSPLHKVRFFLSDPPFDTEVKLTNLSKGGAGFWIKDADSEEESPWPNLGTYIRGELVLLKKNFQVMMRIVYKGATVVGCAFSEAPKELEKVIEEYFKIELGALKMKRVASGQIKSVPDGKPNWIFGDSNCELYFVMNNDELVRFNLSFFANYVEGGRNKPTRYGQVVASDLSDEDLKYKAAELIQWEDKNRPDLKDTAIKFLENIPQLTPEERSKIVGFL